MIVETATPVALATSVAVRPGWERYSCSVMRNNLRETQTEVKRALAPHALASDCGARKNVRMKNRLEEIRGHRTLEEIAEKVGVAVSTIQRYEKGAIDIPTSRYPAIAKAYGAEINRLLGNDTHFPEADQALAVLRRVKPENRFKAIQSMEIWAEAENGK